MAQVMPPTDKGKPCTDVGSEMKTSYSGGCQSVRNSGSLTTDGSWEQIAAVTLTDDGIKSPAECEACGSRCKGVCL